MKYAINLIKEKWSDPVWSKVISAIIIAILTYAFLTVKSWVDNLSLRQTYKDSIDYLQKQK